VRRWGHFVYRRRKAVLAASLACFVLSIVGLLAGGQPINATNYDVESVRAANLESAQLPSTTGSSFTLILTSAQATFGQPVFGSAVNSAVAPLRSDSRVSALATPFSVAPVQVPLMVSDGQAQRAGAGWAEDRLLAGPGPVRRDSGRGAFRRPQHHLHGRRATRVRLRHVSRERPAPVRGCVAAARASSCS